MNIHVEEKLYKCRIVVVYDFAVAQVFGRYRFLLHIRQRKIPDGKILLCFILL
jgi:hypothetical protein